MKVEELIDKLQELAQDRDTLDEEFYTIEN